MNKQTYFPEVINWAQEHGFDEIRANLPDNNTYETPIRYERVQDDVAFTPDVTGKSFSNKSYFEVILKTDKIQRLLSKLKLISLLASRQKGKLYLMVPKGHFQFARNMCRTHRLRAELVKL
ncbi:hypothetical protein WBJ53_15485 [Spirosoma sp. SC4-14]|uniref:hypothetical protein n=1 Tax=Spirosoma sp. SC4-14 TaxID=3128900 RepID=UPI0030CE8568